MTPVSNTDTAPAALKRISWGAIFAGAVVAVCTGLVLNLLGLGIGLSAFDPVTDGDSAGGFGIGQGIWFVLSSLLSLFAGGWVAGHLAGMPRRVDGLLHGLVTWGLTTLLTVYLVSSGVGTVVGGVTSLVGSGLRAAGSGIAAVAPGAADAAQRERDQRGITLGTIQQEAESLLRDTGDPDLQPGALEDQADAAAGAARDGAQDADLRGTIDRVLGRAQGVASEVDRQDLVNVLVARSDMSEAEARQTVARWEGTLGQAGQQLDTLRANAAETAEGATDAVGGAALAAFVALLLGALAAAFGGGMGAKHVFKEEYPEGHPYREPYVVRVYDTP